MTRWDTEWFDQPRRKSEGPIKSPTLSGVKYPFGMEASRCLTGTHVGWGAAAGGARQCRRACWNKVKRLDPRKLDTRRDEG